MAKQEWLYHSTYKGCVIECRPGMQRRGWISRYRKWNHDGKEGCFIHHSLENAKKHIDKLHKVLGDRIAVK